MFRACVLFVLAFAIVVFTVIVAPAGAIAILAGVINHRAGAILATVVAVAADRPRYRTRRQIPPSLQERLATSIASLRLNGGKRSHLPEIAGVFQHNEGGEQRGGGTKKSALSALNFS